MSAPPAGTPLLDANGRMAIEWVKWLAQIAAVVPSSGAGSPEGVVSAPVGALYQRLDGGAGTSVYVKESGGSGNTGWVAK